MGMARAAFWNLSSWGTNPSGFENKYKLYYQAEAVEREGSSFQWNILQAFTWAFISDEGIDFVSKGRDTW